MCNSSHYKGCIQILNGKHHIKVNNAIKILYDGSSEKGLNETLDTFWSEYTKFNHNNDPYDSNEFIWSSKDAF